MSSHLLSKSSFLKGVQCQKALYLYKNHYKLRDAIPTERMAVFNRGHDVGFLSHKLFPGGIDASPPKVSRYSESVEKTKQLIAGGTKTIYEAAFQHSDVLAAPDILVKSENKWYAYEVKSSAKISSTYILDAALQYWVIKNSGIDIADFFIINLNKNYIRNGGLELEKLFSKTSVLNEIIAKQNFIEENVSTLKKVLLQHKIPEIPIGSYCHEPYDCNFIGYCWRDVPNESVFEIPAMPLKEKFELYNRGIKKCDDIPADLPIGEFQKTHIESKKSGKPFIDYDKLKDFLSPLKYPLLFVDFEVMMPAIPVFEGTRPFQNIPFQYSVHVKNMRPSPTGKKPEPILSEEEKHFSFLAETGNDPRRDFIENFLRDIQGSGSVIAYDSTLEKSVLNSLKKDFPGYSDEINAVLKRFIDLMLPFKNIFFYSYKMKGNFSLKDVGAALLPGLNFDNLKISNGRLAMIAYENLLSETDIFKIMETKEALMEYSKTDTETMMKIVEMLEEVVVNR